MPSITGARSRTSAESVDAIEGGEVSDTSRVSTCLASSSRNRALSLFGEMPGMRRYRSARRCNQLLSGPIPLGVQASPSNAIHALIGRCVEAAEPAPVRLMSGTGLLLNKRITDS